MTTTLDDILAKCDANDDMPLPDKPGGGRAVYKCNQGDHHEVECRPGGGYYGKTSSYDYSAKSASAMRAKLKGWGAKHIGWEK